MQPPAAPDGCCFISVCAVATCKASLGTGLIANPLLRPNSERRRLLTAIHPGCHSPPVLFSPSILSSSRRRKAQTVCNPFPPTGGSSKQCARKFLPWEEASNNPQEHSSYGRNA